MLNIIGGITRGAVVKDYNGKKPGIVMGKVKPDNYSRAYGDEVYVCKVMGDTRGVKTLVSDAIKMHDKAGAKRVVDSHAIIVKKNMHDQRRVGKVRKIPQLCLLAMKIEKGTF